MTTDLVLLAIRSSVVMALALAAVACLSGWSAALRHRVLALAFCGAVVVGPLVSVVPEWRVLPAPPSAWPAAASEPVVAVAATAPAATVAAPGRVATEPGSTRRCSSGRLVHRSPS